MNIYYGPAYFDPNSSPWVYDDRNAKFYYYGTSGNVEGLYVYTRAGNFSDGTMIAKNVAVVIPSLFNKFFSDEISYPSILAS